jgi:hypothetical protein
MQSLTYQNCLEYWNIYINYNTEDFVCGIVSTPTEILPYIRRKDKYFNLKFNTIIPQTCNVYYLFKSIPSLEEFSLTCKNLMLYLKQQSISQDFQ